MDKNQIEKICQKSMRRMSTLLDQVASYDDREIDKYFSGCLYRLAKSFLFAICVGAKDPDIIIRITGDLKSDLEEEVSDYLRNREVKNGT